MNAFKNLIRMPVRNILFLLIYMVLTAILLFVLIINGIAKSNIDDAIGPLGNSVKVSSEMSTPRVDLLLAEKISNNFGIIKSYHARAQTLCDLPQIQCIEADSGTGTDINNKFDPFTLNAVTSTSCLKEFYSGRRVIVSGEGITSNANESGKLFLVVSQDIADKNGLSLGDSIQMSIRSVYSKEPLETTVYVGGIYKDTVSLASDSAYSYQIPENEVYIPISVYKHMLSFTHADIGLKELYFELKNTSDSAVNALETRLRNIGYSATSDIELTLFSPENEAAAMAKLSNSLQVAIVSVVICFTLSFLGILLWNLQSRTREIGTYCIIGTKRSSVSSMLTCETLILYILAFFIVLSIAVIMCSTSGVEILSFVTKNGAVQGETTLNSVVQNEIITSNSISLLSNGKHLILNFVIPSAVQALICCMLAIFTSDIVSRILISRLDIMKVMGGRAQ